MISINLFTIEQRGKVIAHFGETFYERVLKNIKTYSAKWQLSDFQFIESYSVNCVFSCRSELFGDVILKIGHPSKETYTEYHALREFNGRRYCKVYDADLDQGVIIEERIKPGNTLWEGTTLDERLAVFCSLYKGLHIAPTKPEIYFTYIDWLNRAVDNMSNQQEHLKLYEHMKKARDLCIRLSEVYSRKLLLHGDIHPENILLGSDGKYVIIDPKGIVGDPVFDFGQYVLNEFDEHPTEETYHKISYIVDYFAREFELPRVVVAQSIYIQTTLSNCWNVEGNMSPSYEHVSLAEALIPR